MLNKILIQWFWVDVVQSKWWHLHLITISFFAIQNMGLSEKVYTCNSSRPLSSRVNLLNSLTLSALCRAIRVGWAGSTLTYMAGLSSFRMNLMGLPLLLRHVSVMSLNWSGRNSNALVSAITDMKVREKNTATSRNIMVVIFTSLIWHYAECIALFELYELIFSSNLTVPFVQIVKAKSDFQQLDIVCLKNLYLTF